MCKNARHIAAFCEDFNIISEDRSLPKAIISAISNIRHLRREYGRRLLPLGSIESESHNSEDAQAPWLK